MVKVPFHVVMGEIERSKQRKRGFLFHYLILIDIMVDMKYIIMVKDKKTEETRETERIINMGFLSLNPTKPPCITGLSMGWLYGCNGGG